MVIPTLAPFEDKAPLTKCALKTDESMPDCSNRDLSQRSTELKEVGLYGLIIVNSNLVPQPEQTWFFLHKL